MSETQINESTIESVVNCSEAVEESVPSTKKRGRKPGKKRKGYFYEDEEEAFRFYVESTDKFERDRVFREKLYPAFTKMIESLIRRYNLFTPDEEFEDTFYDTMSFLLTKVNNFDFSRGKKVYSYCGTICKNYLILKRLQYIKNNAKLTSYESYFNDSNPDMRIVDNARNEAITFNSGLMKKMLVAIADIFDRAEEFKLTENEKKVGEAVKIMLETWDEIFQMTETRKFNKSSVLYFIKEYTMLNTKDVREALRIYKDLYYIVKEEYVNTIDKI